MNLYRLELKRVCKTRMTAILLAIALVLAVVMAYLPVTFIGWTELDASGNEVRYTGLKAIRKRQEQQVSGTITPDVMQEALEAYQRVYRQYDASSINDIPVEVFYKELARYQPLVNNAKEAFADPKTGMAPGVMGLTAEDMQNFYSQLPKRLGSVIWLEQSGKPGYEQAQAIAQKKFDAVQKPFTYSFGVSSDAMDYQTLLSLLLTLLCAVIAAPVFASDAQTGAQDIQLCTKNGGLRLAAAKLAAAFSITGAAYLLCGVVWILVTNALFGWESTQTSVQWLFSVTSLLPYTVGQMEWVMLAANFLIFFAEVAFVLMASVWAKNNLIALSVALISVVAPLIVYMVVPGSFGEWLSTLLPAGGIGLSNALMYKMISFDFLYAGGHAFEHKPGAAVAVARRGGTSTTFDVLNKYFTIKQMPVVASTYWNNVFGRVPGDADGDAEGLATMRNIGKNMAWLLRCIEAGQAAGINAPEADRATTNFIR